MDLLRSSDLFACVVAALAGVLALASAVVLAVIARTGVHARTALVAAAIEALSIVVGPSLALVTIRSTGQSFGSQAFGWMLLGPAAQMFAALASAIVVANAATIRILRAPRH